MEIRARTKDRVVILDLHGHIDANSANLIEVIGQCLRDGYNDILCNFAEVDFIDYMGISAIFLAYKEVMNNKGRLKFVNISPHLMKFFSIAGLDRVVDIYATEDLAVNSFKEDKVIENIKKLQLRRKFKRLPIDIKIEFKARHDKKAVCHKADILDLSAIGAYIFGCDKFRLGDEIVLKFELPTELEGLELDAKVVWLSDKELQLHIHPGMGVEFHKISVSDQQELIRFIEKNLSFI